MVRSNWGPERPEPVSELSVPEALSMAIGLHQGGRLQQAETLYRRILALVPEHPDALHLLGVLRHQLGASDEGVALISRAVSLAPDFADFRNNLGNVLLASGRLAEAEEAFRETIARAPEHASARCNLGTALKRAGRVEEAVEAFREALRIEPGHADAWHNLGNALRRLGRVEESVDAWKRAVELKPQSSDTWHNLAASLCRAGRDEQAREVLEEWLAWQPENPVAQHLLAGLTGTGHRDRAPDEYVRTTFDDLAGTFDERLADLEYRGPELLAAALQRELGEGRGDLDVLDAGCGTGLCAPVLAPYAGSLEGVDLSGGMLDRARARGLYGELHEAELTAFLAERPGRYDLVACVETLNYFGELDDALLAAAESLREGGRLLFTLEEGPPEAAPEGHRLMHHGRYVHTRDYLRGALDRAGLVLLRLEPVTLRLEFGEPQPGLVVTAGRGPREVP